MKEKYSFEKSFLEIPAFAKFCEKSGNLEKNDISEVLATRQLVLEAKCPLYSKFGARLGLAKLKTSIIFPRSKLSLLMLLRQIFLAKHMAIVKTFIFLEKYESSVKKKEPTHRTQNIGY